MSEQNRSAESVQYLYAVMWSLASLLVEKINSRPTSSSTWFLFKSHSWGGGNKCVLKRWGEGGELDKPVNYTPGGTTVGECGSFMAPEGCSGLLIYFCSALWEVWRTHKKGRDKPHTEIQISSPCAGKDIENKKDINWLLLLLCWRRICSMLNGLPLTEPPVQQLLSSGSLWMSDNRRQRWQKAES